MSPGQPGADLVADEAEQFQAQRREVAVFFVLALDQFAPEKLGSRLAEDVFFQFRGKAQGPQAPPGDAAGADDPGQRADQLPVMLLPAGEEDQRVEMDADL